MKENKSVKYLGVIIDCNLNWKDHVFELCKKISNGKGIGILFKLRDFVSIALIQVNLLLSNLPISYVRCPGMGTYIQK
jgi:hypothetical protein